MDETSIEVPSETPIWQRARAVIQQLQRAGHQAYAVGGCVRDLLCGVPIHDIDCCTSASPEQVEQLFPATIAVGKQFGVIIVVHAPGEHTEIASFRSDRAYVDGRHPSGVDPASEEQDAWRRDFSINALYLDTERGLVRDHVGGLADIRARRLRCVGDAAARLREDRLRVLRGIRFVAHYDLDWEAITLAAVEATDLNGVSRERLQQEWCKGIGHPRGWVWLQSLQRSRHRQSLLPQKWKPPAGSWEALWPEVASDPVVATAVALMSVSRDDVTAWLDRWSWAKVAHSRISRLHQLLADLLAGNACERQRRRWWTWAEPIDQLLGWLQRSGLIETETLRTEYQLVRRRPGRPLLDGRAMLAAGVSPGPRIGQLLEQLLDAQLAGQVRNQAEAEAWLQHEQCENP